MTMLSSRMTQLNGRLLAWASRQGSTLQLIAVVILVAGVVAWLLGLTNFPGLLTAIGAALLVWGIGSLLYRTLGP